MFQVLFERSTDPIWLLDPDAGIFVDCNDAAVQLMGYATKDEMLRRRPDELSPTYQPDGRLSTEASAEIAARIKAQDRLRFEWIVQRADGTQLPVEVVATQIPCGERMLQVAVTRDITERKRAEAEIREWSRTLEERVEAATAELRATEAQLRTLVEHAPEAIVVFAGTSGRFEIVNQHAVQLFGRSREELLQLTLAGVSPLYQANGRSSTEAARENIQAALAGETPVFEWVHRHSSGRLFTSEVRLVRLPGDHCCLLRASIIDNTERKRGEQVQRATYEISEAVHVVEDLPSLYACIHRIVGGLMPARNFYIALFDAAAETISFPYFVDEAEAAPSGLALGEGLTSYVLRTGKPLLVGAEMNARKRLLGGEVTFEGIPDLRYVETGSPAAIWLGVPLRVGSKPFGVMAVQDYYDTDAYGDGEKQLLAFVAGQTALAIDRKRAAQALRESEEKFRALFEGTSTGVMIHDDQQYLEVNPAIVRMLGYQSVADLIGKNPVMTSPPVQPGGTPTADLARRYLVDCLRNGTARFEWLARRADGRDIPVEVMLTRIEMGGRQLMQAVVTDITERKRAEAELRASEARLRESQARFRTAFRASPVLMSISRLSDGKWVEANDAFLQWSGYTREEVVGRDSREFGLWVDPAARERFWIELRSCGSVRDRECELRTRDGSLHTVLLSGDVIELNGEPHVLLAAVEITQRKQAEAEVLKALAREKELGQLKSNFVSMVSHEFRTPLGIIQSSAEILRDYLEQLNSAERNEHLRSIVRNTSRMSAIMEEVLVLGKLDAGKMEYQPASIDLRAFCSRLTDEVHSATDRRCPIDLTIAQSLNGDVSADERLLRHIFTNLLTNAVKYSECDTHVQFSVERESRELKCVVRDEGIGIPDGDCERLFQAFHRGANVSNRPGTGLGLVIVKRCVELHNGRIDIASKVGQGTTVTVRLPVFAK